MSELILGPTSMAQWQKLIFEAEQACSIQLGEEIESYLVFLLMRFTEKPEMANSVLALEFLNSQHETGSLRAESLRDLGDKCLLLSGLFPGRARRRRVTVNYFVRLGQSAYQSLANYQQTSRHLYAGLMRKFVPMMDILQTTRELSAEKSFLEIFDALQLWSDTQSQHALKVLKQFHIELPMNLPNNIPGAKH